MGTAQRPCRCEDENCPVQSIMTMAEFAMHRPKAHQSLLKFLDDNGLADDDVMSVMPEYENDELFSVCLHESHVSGGSCIAVLVKGTHPMAMLDEEAPGVPTWWWEEDLR